MYSLTVYFYFCVFAFAIRWFVRIIQKSIHFFFVLGTIIVHRIVFYTFFPLSFYSVQFLIHFIVVIFIVFPMPDHYTGTSSDSKSRLLSRTISGSVFTSNRNRPNRSRNNTRLWPKNNKDRSFYSYNIVLITSIEHYTLVWSFNSFFISTLWLLLVVVKMEGVSVPHLFNSKIKTIYNSDYNLYHIFHNSCITGR